MLNRRRNVILFVVLVVVGSGLLAGATISESLGILLLGAALAWVVGSDPAFRTYQYLLGVPGRTWPLVRVLILMAFGGGLLAAVAFWSELNAFLIVTAMCLWGVLISPFMRLPGQSRTVRSLAWLLGFVALFFGALVASNLTGTLAQHAEALGRETGFGMIALVIGVMWLTKGWKLVQSGLTVASVSEGTQADRHAQPQGAKLLYLSLFSAVLLLTAWLGILTFSGFSDSVFKIETAAQIPQSSNPTSAVLFLMLLAWWTYATWKHILARESNTVPSNLRLHKRITTTLGAFFIIVVTIASAFGLQNGRDRKLTAEIEHATKSFQDVAREIGAIKSRDLQTTQDYIQAYEELEPLQIEFAQEIQNARDFLSQEEQRNKERGPLNIQLLYGNAGQEWLAFDDQLFPVLSEESGLISNEVQVIKQMAALPKQDQVKFWKKNFLPLLRREDSIRQNLTSIRKREPGTTKN